MKKFQYNNAIYSERQVRQEVFKQTRKAVGKPKNGQSESDFWAKFGVAIVEEKESLDVVKQKKAFAIKQAFLRWRNSDATLVSSFGFLADSNERTKSDIDSLLDLYEKRQDAVITFRDADNVFHNLSYENLKTLKSEVIENGIFAYQQKWELDSLVENAVTLDEIEQVKILFYGKNYLMKG